MQLCEQRAAEKRLQRNGCLRERQGRHHSVGLQTVNHCLDFVRRLAWDSDSAHKGEKERERENQNRGCMECGRVWLQLCVGVRVLGAGVRVDVSGYGCGATLQVAGKETAAKTPCVYVCDGGMG